MTELITVEVAYALPQKQVLKSLSVEPGTTALEAVKMSGILESFPEIDAKEAMLDWVLHFKSTLSSLEFCKVSSM